MSHAGGITKPKHGEKMIEVKIKFWTNGIANREGYIMPKHAWGSGVVYMERNESHGIIPRNPRHFHSLMDISSVIEKVLIQHEITLNKGRVMEKYLE
jgi:hypothetical protein